MVLQGLEHLVAPLLLSHPQLDSEQLAAHLEAAAGSGRLPGGATLAEQLLVRLGAHDARCRLLLRQGRPQHALQLARQRRLTAGELRDDLLAAGAASHDAILMAAAQRVCNSQAILAR
jgi:hypothetical protein